MVTYCGNGTVKKERTQRSGVCWWSSATIPWQADLRILHCAPWRVGPILHVFNSIK